MEFEGACSNRMDGNPVAIVEALIHINNQLHQHEVTTFSDEVSSVDYLRIIFSKSSEYFLVQAAVGILTYAQQNLGVQLKESW